MTQEHIMELTNAIINSSKTIDMYIKSLPGIEATEEDQLRRIEDLENENKELGELILKKVEETGMAL